MVFDIVQMYMKFSIAPRGTKIFFGDKCCLTQRCVILNVWQLHFFFEKIANRARIKPADQSSGFRVNHSLYLLHMEVEIFSFFVENKHSLF